MGVILRIRRRDAGRLSAHLERLAGDDRAHRFGRNVKDAFIRKYVASIDWRRSLHYGLFERGAVRAAIDLAWPRLDWLSGGEFALSVEPDHQRAGVGTALLGRLVTGARNRGLGSLYMVAASDNEGMLALAHRFDFAITRTGTDYEGRLALPPRDSATRRDELWHDLKTLPHSILRL